MTPQSSPATRPLVPIHTILFDLDGTLADTAPDLGYALNQVRTEQGLPTLALEDIQPTISLGGRAMIEFAFGIARADPSFERLYARFLDLYADNVATHSRLFPGMEEVLAYIEARPMRWGIVTNKVQRLTARLVEALGLAERAACVVCGDTTPRPKPYPDPLLFACKAVGDDPRQCLYIGDAPRDILAGKQAGMATLVALFGYIPVDDDPLLWGADGSIKTPLELIEWLQHSVEETI